MAAPRLPCLSSEAKQSNLVSICMGSRLDWEVQKTY